MCHGQKKEHTTIKMRILGTKENAHEIKWILKQQTRGAQLAQSVGHTTLDPEVLSWSPTLGIEITQN